MSQERRDDIIPVVEGCRDRWDKYNVEEREEVLGQLELKKSEAWYEWSALMTDTRNAIIAEEMEFLVGKYQEDYQRDYSEEMTSI